MGFGWEAMLFNDILSLSLPLSLIRRKMLKLSVHSLRDQLKNKTRRPAVNTVLRAAYEEIQVCYINYYLKPSYAKLIYYTKQIVYACFCNNIDIMLLSSYTN